MVNIAKQYTYFSQDGQEKMIGILMPLTADIFWIQVQEQDLLAVAVYQYKAKKSGITVPACRTQVLFLLFGSEVP